MKKYLAILLMAVAAIACKKATPEVSTDPYADLYGHYTMQCVTNSGSGYSTKKWTMEIEETSWYHNAVSISIIIPFCYFYSSWIGGSGLCRVYGQVSDDLKTITITLPQQLEATAYYAFYDSNSFVIYGWSGKDLSGKWVTGESKIVFTRQADGSYTTTDSFGMTTSEVTDRTYYNFMNVFSQYDSATPTMFTKVQ